MKKLLVGFGAVAFALVGASMFAAFEAHVVNVTATIENALSVPTTPITFGTVFPQEHLNKNLEVALSGSFLSEGRVDHVSYFIRQKPKCAWTWQVNNVWNMDQNSTQTGHVIPTLNDPQTTPDESNGGTAYTIDCGSPIRPEGVPTDATWGQLPSLCEYISKHPDTDVANDGSLNSFHPSFTVANSQVAWTDTRGYLDKSDQDTLDKWTIDLAVPCFGGYCAQDWANFVRGINRDADPAVYTQPIANEHKIFGCDLWVEVNGVDNVIE